MLTSLITVLHIVFAVLLIIIVLLQQGKGADVGATFGGGGNTLFGASGADTFLTRITTFLALSFMVTSIYLASQGQIGVVSVGGLADSLPDEVKATTPKKVKTDLTEEKKASKTKTTEVKTTDATQAVVQQAPAPAVVSLTPNPQVETTPGAINTPIQENTPAQENSPGENSTPAASSADISIPTTVSTPAVVSIPTKVETAVENKE